MLSSREKTKAMNGEEEKFRKEGWQQGTKALLTAVQKETCQPYSIPVVPDNLWKLNESAYIPKVVSIGPQYIEKKELLQMEEIKWQCVSTLLSRTFGLDSIEKCMEKVLELDATVRASYVDVITLDKYDLARNMVFDGCFLLELLICKSKYDSELPIPFQRISPGIEVKRMEYVLSDLLLLDNQIPIYILEKLFDILLGSSNDMRELIQNLVLPFFGFTGKTLVKHTFHFLDTVHSYMELGWINTEKEKIVIDTKDAKEHQNLNRCATRLKAVGITIELLNVSECTNFIYATEFDRRKRILKIPRLVIDKTTEATWRSFIAWEHHKKKLTIGSSSSVERLSTCTSSALLFSDLICCTGDVQLLKDRGIIEDNSEKSKSKRDLMAFFHSIAMGVDRGVIDSNHNAMFKVMNTTHSANCVTQVFILLNHYFCQFLDSCYNVHMFFKKGYHYAFTIAGFLTFVQTVYSIMAYHFPKK